MPKIIENVKTDILEAARRMLMETGYDAFNMRALAEECGISVGTLYNYYPSKIDIVLSIMEEAWEHAFAAIDAAISKLHDPVEQAMTVYTILREGYTSSHSTWIESYDSMTKDMSTAGARTCREGIHGKLAEKIFIILQNAEGTAAEDTNAWRSMGVRADALARLIQAYCAVENWSDSNMRMLVDKMIGPRQSAAEDMEAGEGNQDGPASTARSSSEAEGEEWILW